MSRPPAPADDRDLIPGELTALAQVAARFAVVALGGLYTIGLLIVNIDLAQYGLTSLDLARPEYIMAGGLWAFLSITSAWIIRSTAMAHGLPKLLGAPNTTGRRFVALLFGACVAAFLFIGLLAIHPQSPPPKWWQIAIGSGAIASGGSFIFRPLLREFAGLFESPVMGRRQGGVRALWALIRPSSLVSFVTLVLPVLAAYATIAFPELPRAFGGGRKPVVDLVFDEVPDLPWAEFGVQVDGDRKRIGPAMLLLETGQLFILSRADGESGKSGWPEAFGIDKKKVVAIVYKPRTRRSPSTQPAESPGIEDGRGAPRQADSPLQLSTPSPRP